MIQEDSKRMFNTSSEFNAQFGPAPVNLPADMRDLRSYRGTRDIAHRTFEKAIEKAVEKL
jgi:hypothetical protein